MTDTPELFPGLPDSALVADREAMKAIRPGSSDMFLWRERQRGNLPEPVKINDRNYLTAAVWRTYYRHLLGTTDQGEAA